ncbi:MAG: hypothetical protein DWI57_02235 [Chloroflexi bacterium]|nr:MAG: hypothetical protein DWI57_02235 [Chloroflexota bacterium]
MLRKWLLHLGLALLAMFVLAACQPILLPPPQAVQAVPAQPVLAAAPAMLPWDQITIEQKIANAMSGGPAAISREAKIVEWTSEMPVLREGTNGWTCIPDEGFPFATTPLNDPLCYDEAWIPWFDALFAGTDPILTRPGVVYGYPGTASIDNDDPFAAAPPAGKGYDFIPPHIALSFPGGVMPEGSPTAMHEGMNMPFVMYPDTPYQHVMAPIVIPSLTPVDPADRIGSAMSAGPSEIAQDATILDWPTEAGGEWSVLREGSNGWTCLPDDYDPNNEYMLPMATPVNDPMCLDASFTQWFKAYMAGTDPNLTTPGIGYMFFGGANADNDDPSIMAPAEGGTWNIEPRHIMVVYPEPLDPTMSHDHHYGGPYVMFAGTPYEHLMIPVDPVVVGD